MSEPAAIDAVDLVTDKAVEAGVQAALKLYPHGQVNVEIAERDVRAVLEGATPWLAFTAGGLAADLLREKDQRIAALEAALADVLPRFTQGPDGWRARISGTVLARHKATLDGRAEDG